MLKRLLIGLGVFAFLFLSGGTISAHPLFPPGFEEFMRTNPTASPLEIQAWINTHPGPSEDGPSAQSTKLLSQTQNSGSFIENGFVFIRFGIEHIFSGLDHVLFLIAMILTYKTRKDIVALVTTFTTAHSVTFILSGTLFFSVSSQIVEPLIAFSIAGMALPIAVLKGWKEKESLRKKQLVVFLFGLMHGLGFAGLLKDIHIPSDVFLPSLLFFNLGIEIGQFILVGCFIAPVLYLVRKTRWESVFVWFVAISISLVGIYWGVERIFG